MGVQLIGGLARFDIKLYINTTNRSTLYAKSKPFYESLLFRELGLLMNRILG